MTKLISLLREYDDRCWYKHNDEQRFAFATEEERFIFIKRLNEIQYAKYWLYGENKNWKIDVFIED